MRKFVKAAAALTAGCMLLSTSAFAMESNLVLDADNALTDGAIEVAITKLNEGESTILVLKGEVALADIATEAEKEGSILYINQDTISGGAATYNVNLGADFEGKATVFAGGTNEEAKLLGVLSSDSATSGADRDFITSADTDKATIKVNVASVTHESMGAAVGKAIVALGLDTATYPNAGQETAGYVVNVVDAEGNAIDGATVYYSAERARYIALIPTNVAEYKFEVLAEGTANEVISKYANINEDNKGTINALDYAQLKNMVKVASNSVAISNAKKALIADVNGDGRVNALDAAQIKKAVQNTSYTIAVITNSKFN